MTLANETRTDVTEQFYVKSLWPKLSDSEVDSKMASIPLSFVIVRHPFSRLASLYYEKISKGPTLGASHLKRMLLIDRELKKDGKITHGDGSKIRFVLI